MSEKKMYLLKYKEVCRCCLDNPGSRNMWEEYINDNESEVYGQMLCDCFGVTWEADNDELICDSCVFRLREAVKLKIEFLAAQEVLNENVVLENGKQEIKYEYEVELEQDEHEAMDVSDMFYSQLNDTESMTYAINKSAVLELQHEKQTNKRTYKNYTNEAMSKAMEAVTVHGKSMLEAATKYSVPRKTLALRLMTPVEEQEAKQAGEEKKLKLVNEIKILLQNTNVVPFKTKSTKRYCAYCFTDGPTFDDNSELRAHMKFYHKRNYLRDVEFMMRPWHINEVLKVDITELACTVCQVSIDDWNSMFIHFAENHHQEFDDAYNKIIPYTLLQDNKCALCYETFATFSGLDVHMNAHYCNYICYECGDPFLSSLRLDAHLRLHKSGKYPCEKCDKVFALQQQKLRHVDSVHGQFDKSMSASMTDETNDRREKKAKKPVTETPCEYCGECFTTSTLLNIHIKKTHIKRQRKSKKNYVCGVCGTEFQKFVDLKYHWREHMETIPFRKMGNVTIG